MKNYMFLFVAIFNLQISFSQSETSLIEKTLKNYTEGSSYNKPKMLESAFYSKATLYLTGKKGFNVYSPKEYVVFFKNSEIGKFNGRNSKVLAIEVIKDIATAKVEISGPDRKWVYIDLFLLKKIDQNWVIISKTATKVSDDK